MLYEWIKYVMGLATNYVAVFYIKCICIYTCLYIEYTNTRILSKQKSRSDISDILALYLPISFITISNDQ